MLSIYIAVRWQVLMSYFELDPNLESFLEDLSVMLPFLCGLFSGRCQNEHTKLCSKPN